ncbi:MAG: riboflavin synthase [Furfurilactobacillus sp.]|jgi:riboflavin synthase|uniref:riboflavin synthase n=1 Tax=Furfurilactobacillus TaxID=2767882 RepID=UPI001F30FF9B|nr:MULTISPECIES: riboflavin synthase [Furfurilactobacillus]MCF6418471.1 riboflavin synthase [Furfurilactobacillus milii]MCH4011977.1 riboflavin synthase [Furfurilactobacillus sp.]MCH4037869.1 riboflavin synthase [Furfurilactobacillus sp.]MCH4115494.1 riboflavin synthase [Furfurilactobacillus sp.]MCI1341084.1 riboflavin synthase [Furfurilactobacillus sp.]
MFTGIIGGLGEVTRIHRQSHTLMLEITIPSNIRTGLQLGDSLSVNGVCLTATSVSDSKVILDVMPETFKRTTLSSMNIGQTANLERAIPADGRFDGHIVQGHVDGVGRIIREWQDENARFVQIRLPQALTNQVVTKGAIAVDGTSLTVVQAMTNWFTVSLIPQTQSVTTLATKRAGAEVNIEIDVIYRYLQNMKGDQPHGNAY